MAEFGVMFWQGTTHTLAPNCYSNCCPEGIAQARLLNMRGRLTFVLVLRPEKGIDGLRAIRALIKVALRKFGLRLVTIREDSRSTSRRDPGG
jgi:hypothetical protein